MKLKEATAEKHKIAEQMLFNRKMLSSELSKDQYIAYLIQQYGIFNIIEERLFDPLHLPTSFYRRDMIGKDINELTGELFPFKYTHEVAGNVIYLPATKRYIEYLNALNDKDMWSHIYLNYCALYYGGQMIKTKILGSGNMYDFSEQEHLIRHIRTLQNDDWAKEVNIGFDHIIEIFKELAAILTA